MVDSGEAGIGQEENGCRPNSVIQLALPVPTATCLYRSLHERGAEGTGREEVAKSFQSQLNENEPERTQSVTGKRRREQLKRNQTNSTTWVKGSEEEWEWLGSGGQRGASMQGCRPS